MVRVRGWIIHYESIIKAYLLALICFINECAAVAPSENNPHVLSCRVATWLIFNFQNWVIPDGWMPPLAAQSVSTAAQWQVSSKFCSETLLNCSREGRCLCSDLKACFN